MAGKLQIKAVSLLRGYVFKAVFGDDPELCRQLLEVTLGVEVSEVRITQAEREFEVAPDRRGGRVDLFVVDTEGNRYDVEVQAATHKDELMRARHYQSLMDVTQLRKGTKAKDLRMSVVVFICGFDPFGDGLAAYDCRTTCLQTNKVMNDGRITLFLNARPGAKGTIPKRLADFLALIAGNEVDSDPFLKDIYNKVDGLVSNPTWMEQYMTLEEEMEYIASAWADERAEKIAEKLVEERVEKIAEEKAAKLAEERVEKIAEEKAAKLAEERVGQMLEGLARLVATGQVDASAVAEATGFPESDILEALQRMRQ